MTDAANGGEAKTYTQADIEKERAHAQHFKQQFDEVSSKIKGIDFEQLQKDQAELAEFRKSKATSGDAKAFDEEVARIRSTVQKDLDTKDEAIKSLTGKLREHQVTDKVFALGAGKFIAGAHDDFRDYIRKHCDLADDGSIIVKGEDGKPRYASGSTTKLMGPEEFVAWVGEIRPHWVASTAVSGGKQPGEKVATHNGQKITSLADAAKLPDKGKQFFKDNPDEAARLLGGKT